MSNIIFLMIEDIKIKNTLHNKAISSILSGTRGVKQLVILKIQTILSGVNKLIFCSISSKLVVTESPYKLFDDNIL